MKRFLKRLFRLRRFTAAMDRLSARLAALPENRWEMTDAEDREYCRLHDLAIRHARRLHNLGMRWGYLPRSFLRPLSV